MIPECSATTGQHNARYDFLFLFPLSQPLPDLSCFSKTLNRLVLFQTCFFFNLDDALIVGSAFSLSFIVRESRESSVHNIQGLVQVTLSPSCVLFHVFNVHIILEMSRDLCFPKFLAIFLDFGKGFRL